MPELQRRNGVRGMKRNTFVTDVLQVTDEDSLRRLVKIPVLIP
jgi:hypothetical protein